jgi:hypothetical protein
VKRLPEHFDPSNADEAYIAGLLQDVKPFDPSAARMQRVWSALERSPSRRPRVRMRGPVVAGLLICAATVASATLPDVWQRWQRRSDADTPIATETSSTATAVKSAHRRVPVAAPAPIAGVEPVADMRPAEPSANAVAPAPAPSIALRKSTPPRSPAPTTPAVDSATSSMLMIEAMRERRAGNLKHARDLAAEYRAKNPSGALYEEALALSLQAAAVLGDDDAKQLAKVYLERYPSGRFRAQAQRVFDGAH